MTPGELIAEALDAICECNSRLDYPRLILMPSPAAFVIDRGAGEFPHLFAFCMIPEPSGATGSDTGLH